MNKENNEGTEIYIFDDVENVDTTKADVPLQKIEKVEGPDTTKKPTNTIEETKSKIIKYAIQFGAFTNLARAENYVKENQSKLDFLLNISFNELNGLYVVWSPNYSSRDEVEKIKNQLRLIPSFKDVFIITESK